MNELSEEDTHETRTEELKGTLSTIAKHVSSLIADAESRARDGDSPNPTARGGLGTIPTAATPMTQATTTSTAVTPTRAEAAYTASGTATTTAVPTEASVRGASPPLPPLLRTAAGDCDNIDNLQHDNDSVVVDSQYFTAVVGDGCRLQGGIPSLAVASMAKSIAGCAVQTAPGAAGKASTAEVQARTRVLRRVSSVRELFLGVAMQEGERLANFSRQMGLPHDTVVTHVRVRSLLKK